MGRGAPLPRLRAERGRVAAAFLARYNEIGCLRPGDHTDVTRNAR
jgi:hypothetical protein